ncbi:hypothetical protein CVD28_01015 [Bacillus sp. M6-12]|uniref:hypothetical protein n=1 Tax=Bacillus sp. M6-12 TaxID=2054166 RepID=UPI000C7865A8|nr:hypothetical protein [Bacillus sp. M6-12]PLS19014.1 hypothetical protein CVD28_01015 [Bacillus sp. M6-12]
MFVEFREKDEMLFLYKEGELVSEVNQPAILWDGETKQILQVGDKENVLNYYNIAMDISKRKKLNLHEHWVLKEFPKNAETLNHVLKHPRDLILFEQDSPLENDIA